MLQVLRHRTQILYVADISLVVANLALTPGKTVLESGTGSGSLTHSLARVVAPHGHVYTFDFHQLRADEAQAEFDRHGLTGMVVGGHRNIEEQGFPQVSVVQVLGQCVGCILAWCMMHVQYIPAVLFRKHRSVMFYACFSTQLLLFVVLQLQSWLAHHW
jgi:predicted methyltransferase